MNPFNITTTISFSIHSRSFVTLNEYDAMGREVETLVSKELDVGTYSTHWNTTGLPSGIYFYTLRADKFIETKSLILLR